MSRTLAFRKYPGLFTPLSRFASRGPTPCGESGSWATAQPTRPTPKPRAAREVPGFSYCAGALGSSPPSWADRLKGLHRRDRRWRRAQCAAIAVIADESCERGRPVPFPRIIASAEVAGRSGLDLWSGFVFRLCLSHGDTIVLVHSDMRRGCLDPPRFKMSRSFCAARTLESSRPHPRRPAGYRAPCGPASVRRH